LKNKVGSLNEPERERFLLLVQKRHCVLARAFLGVHHSMTVSGRLKAVLR